MTTSGTITMTMTELDRLKVVQAVCERRLKPGQAADRLALSVRTSSSPGGSQKCSSSASREITHSANPVRSDVRQAILLPSGDTLSARSRTSIPRKFTGERGYLSVRGLFYLPAL